MNSKISLACLVLLPAAARSSDRLSEVVDPSAKVEKVAGGFSFTEGPAWSQQGFLLFSDIPRDLILKLESGDAVSEFLANSQGANGLIFDPLGRLYACQGKGRRVVRIDVTSGGAAGAIEVLAATCQDKKLNSPNDIALDAQGGLYFTDPHYGQSRDHLEQDVMGVYFISPQGTIQRIIDDLQRPNGILVSPDSKRLYVAEPNRGQIYSYPIQKGGSVGKGKLIFTGDPELDGGGPDGMAHDERGNLYATYKGITILDSKGKLIGRIPVPERPANCIIGGADQKTLYITARTSLYRIPLKVRAMKLHGPVPENL